VAIHQAISSSVRLELLPKSTIDIFITVIEADGLESCIAVGSLAASTALADAGIEMFGLVMSCSAVNRTRLSAVNYRQLMKSVQAVVGNEIWLDPVAAESQAASATIILACMPALATVTSIWQSGSMKPQDAIAVRYPTLLAVRTVAGS
jgi:exosome complex component MTR3